MSWVTPHNQKKMLFFKIILSTHFYSDNSNFRRKNRIKTVYHYYIHKKNISLQRYKDWKAFNTKATMPEY